MPRTDQSDKDHPNPAGPDLVWAPWRLRYLETLSDDDAPKPASVAAPRSAPPASSFLETYWQRPDEDEQNHVVVRTDTGRTGGMVLLNKYPYANGHLLVALGEPRPRLLDYDAEQRAAFWALVDAATDLMERALAPQGINLGVNQGRAAGAGVPVHLHAHLVPRWGGDVNFITTVGQTRVIPGSLDAMWRRFRDALPANP